MNDAFSEVILRQLMLKNYRHQEALICDRGRGLTEKAQLINLTSIFHTINI
jgi:hypothetical protein